MNKPRTPRRKPAIRLLVEHHKGPTNVSNLLGGSPVYQEVQRWVKRGWCSPMHLLKLEPHLPPEMTIRDLFEDREVVKKRNHRGQRAA